MIEVTDLRKQYGDFAAVRDLSFTVVLALSSLFDSLVLVALAAVVGLIVLVVEVAAGVWWLGTRFAQLDLSAELKP